MQQEAEPESEKTKTEISKDKIAGEIIADKSESIKEQPKKQGELDKFKLKVERVEKPILTDINIDMKIGDFLVVVGQVGCGKTSLLHSIMEETLVSAGSSIVEGSIAYVEQEPFIYSATVKNNILFGKEFDQARFDQAI